MEKPTWQNTLCSDHATHDGMDGLRAAAKKLGYPYFEWNGRVLSTEHNGMHKVGRSCDFPLCMAEELGWPGGASWHNGMRPTVQDIKLMAHDTLGKDTTLLDIVSGRLQNTLMTIVWPDTGDTWAAIKSVVEALDNYSLRGSDPDGSIAAAVAALRARADSALGLCDTA